MSDLTVALFVLGMIVVIVAGALTLMALFGIVGAVLALPWGCLVGSASAYLYLEVFE